MFRYTKKELRGQFVDALIMAAVLLLIGATFLLLAETKMERIGGFAFFIIAAIYPCVCAVDAYRRYKNKEN